MSKLQLAIHLSRTSVHIAEVLRSNQEIIKHYSFELTENSPSGYKTKLISIFEQLDLKSEYAEYTMAWATPRNTFVPLSVFNASSPKSIFQFMFGEEIDANTVDFNRLMELNMVSVYEIPDWAKLFVVRKFPRTIFKHEHTVTLRALFQMGVFKRKITVGFNDEYVNIDIIDKNELLFSNSFEYQTVEDVLYHLLFVIEQQKLTNKEGEIGFLYIDEKSKNKAAETKQLIEQLKPFKKMEISLIDSALKLQTLCV